MSQPVTINYSPAIHVKPPLLKPMEIVVTPVGELVEIKIGNSTLHIHYEQALLLSQIIRVKAKEAKRLIGDMSRHWSAVGTLEALKQ